MTPDDFRARRAALGLTQRALAERLGVTTRSIERYEAGAQRITPTIARLLATITPVPQR